MSKSSKTRTALSDVLLLYTQREDEPQLAFSYEIECTTFKAVKLTLNFEGSENFSIEGNADGDMKMTVTVRPFTRAKVGRISLVSDDRRASLKMGCEWLMQEPSAEETARHMQNHEATMAVVLKDIDTLKFPPAHEDPKDKKVLQICKNYGKKFVDTEFPPVEASLYKKEGEHGSLMAGEQSNANKTTASAAKKPIEWKRAEEFMHADSGPICLFDQGIEPSDIRQGALGDCWFLCAIAALTEFDVLVKDLFPREKPEDTTASEAGVYRVRFCKNGLWREVRVDDYFPCYPGGGPIYSRSNGNELWVLLLEKAFAKICGSYEAIKSGWAYEAMMDMTGAPCQTFRLDDSAVRPMIDDGSLWKKILNYDVENYIMSASTPGEDVYTETGRRPGKDNSTGLVAGHAYTLISAKQSKQGHRLLKLRNPWGSMEWTGDWSDSSPLWTQEMQDEIEPLVQADDGTFWMSFEDVVKYFYSINICMVRHPSLHPVPWSEDRKKFNYEYDADEATPDSHRVQVPVFVLDVQKAGTFVASVHQEDIRCAKAKPYIDIGVSVLKANLVYGTFSLVAGTGNSVERQNETYQFELQPGKYLVVPTTTGIKLKQGLAAATDDGAAESSSSQELPPLTAKSSTSDEVEFSAQVVAAYGELFDRLDVDADGFLNKAELDQYMMRTEGSPTQDTAYHWLLHNFESRDAPGLSKTGFIKAQQFVFKHTGCDEEKLRNEFKIMGFNAQLKFDAGRSAVLVIHGATPTTSKDFTLTMAPFDHEAYEEAVELPAIAHGECSEFEEGKIQLYKYRSGYGGMSFVVKNNGTKPLVFQLDCSESRNVVSNRDDLSYQETIPVNEAKVLHHLLPSDSSAGSWSWAYSASYMWDE